ncbi:MAG TPA: sterol desaturase family protein [Sphingomicrobium sp.]|jgi:beta-carotene 3-hydroxylase
MTNRWLIPVLVVAATVIAMEIFAMLVHRYVMHGIGWSWHRSHHEPRTSRLERNDLYAIVFAALSVIPFLLADRWPLLRQVGVGLLLYGVLYTLLHDGLVHRRLPLMRSPRNRYLKRLVQAHRLHHAVREREGAVSYGFLYAPPVQRLVGRLRASRPRP